MKKSLLAASLLLASFAHATTVKNVDMNEFERLDQLINFKQLPIENTTTEDPAQIKVYVMCDNDFVQNALYVLKVPQSATKDATSLTLEVLKKSKDFQHSMNKVKEFEESGNIEAMRHWKEKRNIIFNNELKISNDFLNKYYVKNMKEKPTFEYFNMFKNKKFYTLDELKESCHDMKR